VNYLTSAIILIGKPQIQKVYYGDFGPFDLRIGHETDRNFSEFRARCCVGARNSLENQSRQGFPSPALLKKRF
jgi:hypothetical protein